MSLCYLLSLKHAEFKLTFSCVRQSLKCNSLNFCKFSYPSGMTKLNYHFPFLLDAIHLVEFFLWWQEPKFFIKIHLVWLFHDICWLITGSKHLISFQIPILWNVILIGAFSCLVLWWKNCLVLGLNPGVLSLLAYHASTWTISVQKTT